MTFRLARARSGSRRVGSILTRAVGATLVLCAPVALAAPGVGAQAPPATVPAEVVATAQQSVGAVIERGNAFVGWIAADGVVITSDVIAPEVGKSVAFRRVTDTEPQSCWVARTLPKLHLAVLRCDGLEAVALPVATGYPSPGAAMSVLTVTYDTSDEIVTLAHTDGVTASSIDFMKKTRPQFSTEVKSLPGYEQAGATLDFNSGAPVIGADGKVISTILTSDLSGGAPIGTVPAELSKTVADAKELPASFSAAAVLAVGRRALIPVVAGFVLGIIWSVMARDGNGLAKTLGLSALGLVSAVAYTFFTVLVVGPQTLVG